MNWVSLHEGMVYIFKFNRGLRMKVDLRKCGLLLIVPRKLVLRNACHILNRIMPALSLSHLPLFSRQRMQPQLISLVSVQIFLDLKSLPIVSVWSHNKLHVALPNCINCWAEKQGAIVKLYKLLQVLLRFSVNCHNSDLCWDAFSHSSLVVLSSRLQFI